MILASIDTKSGGQYLQGPRQEPLARDRLTEGETLLLDAIRGWISASCRWSTVQSDFRTALGKEKGAAGLIALQALLIFIAANARRRLRIGFVTFPFVSADELALLQLLASAQVGSFEQLRPRLRWLVTSIAIHHADALVRECAAHLSAAAVALPVRSDGRAP